MISQLSEDYNWADVQLGVASLGKSQLVLGLFTRDFAGYLVSQFYQRRAMRHAAAGLTGLSLSKYPLFGPSELSKEVQFEKLDRILSNEISLLKTSIRKLEGTP
jgi:hypothetical protein